MGINGSYVMWTLPRSCSDIKRVIDASYTCVAWAELGMKPLLIIYATREGQSRRIAEHLAATARTRGFAADVINAAEIPTNLSLAGYATILLVASVHIGKHEREMAEFVKVHRPELEAMRSIFISVSLSEVGAEDLARSAEMRARSAADVQRVVDTFLADTGWHPSKVHAAAGALCTPSTTFLSDSLCGRSRAKKGSAPIRRRITSSPTGPRWTM